MGESVYSLLLCPVPASHSQSVLLQHQSHVHTTMMQHSSDWIGMSQASLGEGAESGKSPRREPGTVETFGAPTAWRDNHCMQ